MDIRMRIAVASEELNVSAFCREHGLKRTTFYFWRKRYQQAGTDGLEPRSRRPKTNPRAFSTDVEDVVVGLRKELDDAGLDAGPDTIQWHLGRRGLRAVPSRATIWRILVRRGFVVPEPRKRPKSAGCRFEASAPNELWQADFTEWPIATGMVRIFNFLDDHSRVALASRAVAEATSVEAWNTFSRAAELWGVPLGQLSDNGLCFSGKIRGFSVHFEEQLRAAGVVPRTSRPYHPQTCGKVERFQQTLKKWLRKQPPAADLTELQAQLDAFVAYYNHQRPHRGIGTITPVERWSATPPAINLGIALPGPAQQVRVVVAKNGALAVSRAYSVGVGVRWAGHEAVVHYDDTHMAVFIGHQLVRALEIDRTRRYQPAIRHNRVR